VGRRARVAICNAYRRRRIARSNLLAHLNPIHGDKISLEPNTDRERQTGVTVRIGLFALFVLTLAACSSGATQEQVTTPPAGFDEAFTVGLTEDRQSALLRFEVDSELANSRGVSWRLEEWSGSSWESKWILAGEALTIDEWNDGDYAVGAIEVVGVGPDAVPLPDLGSDGYHRVCQGFGESATSDCGLVPVEPTDPNSAATTMQPTTTLATDG